MMEKIKNKFSFHQVHGGKMKLWDSKNPFEDSAMKQLENLASMPFIFKHVAGMPDVHAGRGATIGSVIATKGAIIPAAVGVDIGCGMIAYQTTLKANDLPNNLHKIRLAVENNVPHGRSHNGGPNDKGSFSEDDMPKKIVDSWRRDLIGRYDKITSKHPKAKSFNNLNQLGTLGGGNHFIELCLDENQNVWIMLHSGSRGAGNRIGMYFINKAKEEMRKYHITRYLPDQDLAYLVEHTEIFDDYINAVTWAQDYAKINRLLIMDIVISTLTLHFPKFSISDENAINCHHNYVEKENHFNCNVYVTRKGAVRARKTDMGIIPGSMGTASFIVRGLGNKESFCSCSHGAGRKMSRTKARKVITRSQHIKDMQGIEGRLDNDVIDESPGAYKDINTVMSAQTDLVEIVHTLHQILNIKG